jgi:hypothetical protein
MHDNPLIARYDNLKQLIEERLTDLDVQVTSVSVEEHEHAHLISIVGVVVNASVLADAITSTFTNTLA